MQHDIQTQTHSQQQLAHSAQGTTQVLQNLTQTMTTADNSVSQVTKITTQLSDTVERMAANQKTYEEAIQSLLDHTHQTPNTENTLAHMEDPPSSLADEPNKLNQEVTNHCQQIQQRHERLLHFFHTNGTPPSEEERLKGLLSELSGDMGVTAKIIPAP